MNGRRKRRSGNKPMNKKNTIMRCKSKMIPVFDSDTCERFFKKENTDSNNNCKNCSNSF